MLVGVEAVEDVQDAKAVEKFSWRRQRSEKTRSSSMRMGRNHELDFAFSLEGNDMGFVGKQEKEPQEGQVQIYPGMEKGEKLQGL